MRRQFSIVFFFCLLATARSTFAQNIKHNFFSGKVHILLPKDFVQATPKVSAPKEPTPEVYFIQKDTIVEFAILKVSKRTDDLKKLQQMLEAAFLMQATKKYSNDIETINGKPVIVTEFESVFKNKRCYNIMFTFNVDEYTLTGNYSVLLPYRDKWKDLGKTIVYSLQY